MITRAQKNKTLGKKNVFAMHGIAIFVPNYPIIMILYLYIYI